MLRDVSLSARRWLRLLIAGFCVAVTPLIEAPAAAAIPLQPQHGLLQENYAGAIEVAEWLSRDPIGESDGPNLYAYVAQNPISNLDPLGLYLEFDDNVTGFFKKNITDAITGGYTGGSNGKGSETFRREWETAAASSERVVIQAPRAGFTPGGDNGVTSVIGNTTYITINHGAAQWTATLGHELQHANERITKNSNEDPANVGAVDPGDSKCRNADRIENRGTRVGNKIWEDLGAPQWIRHKNRFGTLLPEFGGP